MGLFGFGKKSNISQKNADKTQKDAEKADVKSTPKKEETKKLEKKKETRKSTPVSKARESATDLTGIILKPRITEKATILSEESSVYTFNVRPDSTKKEIAKAVEAHYKVKPVKVNISEIKSKRVLRRGKKGMKTGGKKAMVYLKKGDKIEFV